MADDKNKRGAADRDRVNVNEDYELRYWTEKFKCTEAQLRAAVKAVGVMAKDVEVFLQKK
ncbi:MAG: DUF3606 domain-containing protein [Pseudomonadota bacterium]|nr:DUF3606 domain-containing protein [Pseudomonadota bacterium]